MGDLHGPTPRYKKHADRVLTPALHPAANHSNLSLMIRILLADDHAMMRQGLSGLLGTEDDMTVVAECDDGADAVTTALDVGPDVVVMDLGLPTLNGVEATRRITTERPDIRVLALTMYDDAATVDRALRAGARGYVLKGAGFGTLCAAIRAVARGEVYLAEAISSYVVQGYLGAAKPSTETLSSRETEVVQLVAEGFTSAEIAHRLGLRTKTIQNYRTNVMDKLGVKTTAGLVRYALKAGLIR